MPQANLLSLVRGIDMIVLKKLIILLLVCVPLLANKPIGRLNMYLKGETSLLDYLNREVALIYSTYVQQVLLSQSINSNDVDSFLGLIPTIKIPEDALRPLFREDDDVPASWVFAKKFFIQGRDENDLESLFRLGRLIEAYGHVFPEGDLKNAKATLSKMREIANRQDLFIVADTTGEELGQLANELDQSVFQMLKADPDGAEFLKQLDDLGEQITLSGIAASNLTDESLENIGIVISTMEDIFKDVTQNVLDFDPNLIPQLRQIFADVLPSDTDFNHLSQLVIYRREHGQLFIRYLSDEFDTEKFIERYRTLATKYREVYNPECFDCISSALQTKP